MAPDILESYIRQYIQSQDLPEIQFAWQGGEPTLLGVDYFKQVVRLQEKYANGKKISKERNYFPGYIMIEANLGGEMVHTIKNVQGVIGFLGETKGGDPVPLRQSEVNRMLGKVDELSETEEKINIPYIVGETVKVIDGPFNGFNGTIEKVYEDKRKLEVMVKIFGRKTPLELSYMQVEKES